MSQSPRHNSRNVVIPDAVFDGLVSAEALPRMEAELRPAYREGLQAGGFDVDPGELQQAFFACSVEYVRPGPLLLAKAGEQVRHEYRGRESTDANRQYRNRGSALAQVCDWAEKALTA